MREAPSPSEPPVRRLVRRRVLVNDPRDMRFAILERAAAERDDWDESAEERRRVDAEMRRLYLYG